MDLVKAREKARKKAEKEKGEKPGKKAKKAGPELEAEARPPEPAEKRPASKAAKKPAAPPPAEPAEDDVFTDDAFGEDLPFAAAEDTQDTGLMLEASFDSPGASFDDEDDSWEVGSLAGKIEEKLPTQKETGKKSETGKAKKAEPAKQQKIKEEPAKAAPAKSKKHEAAKEKQDWSVSEPAAPESGDKPRPLLKADWEEDDIFSFGKMVTDEEDFLSLVTEDLYMREFGESDEDLSELISFLSFRLSDEKYAVRLTSIRQIIKMTSITMVPRAPGYVSGIISLRGLVIPVFDLRRRLKLQAKDATRKTRIIVVSEGKYSVGLIVDEVEQVLRMHESEIEPPPPILAGIESEFIAGIGRTGEKMIILLDLEKLLVPVVAGKQAKAV